MKAFNPNELDPIFVYYGVYDRVRCEGNKGEMLDTYLPDSIDGVIRMIHSTERNLGNCTENGFYGLAADSLKELYPAIFS